MAEMADALQMVLGMTPSGERPLTAEAREHAYASALSEAQQLVSRSEFEGALNAARRAQALEPSRAEIMALVLELEDKLRDAPTLRPPTPEDAIPTRPSARPPAPRVAGLAAVPSPPAAQASAQLSTLTPPGALPASGLFDALRLRGAAVFRELAFFGEPPSTATASLSPAGDLLATSGTDGAVRIWDLRSRMRARVLRTQMHERTGHDAVALCLAFSGDGRFLASGHVDGCVHLWDMANGQEVPVNLKHEALVGAIAFSPDGRTLASGGMDSNLKLWDVAAAWAGEARRELLRQPSGITALCYVGVGGAWLVTGHANRVLRLLDSRSWRLLATLRGAEAQISLLSVAPGGKRFAAASHDRSIRLYDADTRQQTFVASGHRTKPTTSLAFFPDGRHLASVAQDNAVQLWDLESQTPAAVLWGQAGESFAAVALYAGGDHVAVALADGRIRLWGPAA
jgi:WD40 repeat protein